MGKPQYTDMYQIHTNSKFTITRRYIQVVWFIVIS